MTNVSPFSFVRFDGNPASKAAPSVSTSPRLARSNILCAKAMVSSGNVAGEGPPDAAEGTAGEGTPAAEEAGDGWVSAWFDIVCGRGLG